MGQGIISEGKLEAGTAACWRIHGPRRRKWQLRELLVGLGPESSKIVQRTPTRCAAV